MLLRGFISILFLCGLQVFAADSIEELCQTMDLEQVSCSPKTYHNEILPNDFNQKSLKRWQWIIDKAREKKLLLQAEIDNNKGMLRYIRSDFISPDESREWYEEEFQSIENDFNKLKAISKEIKIASNKLNMCFKVCTPTMRVENEEHLQKLQKLKIILLSKRPILAGPEIEALVSEEKVDKTKLKKALSNTYSDYLTKTQQEIVNLNERFSPEERQFQFATGHERSNEVTERRLERFFNSINGNDSIDGTTSDLLSSIDWKQEVLSEPLIACPLYNENKNYLKSQKIKEIGIELGMIAAPFIAGPAFRLGIWGLRGAGLAKWGMREELYANITKATAGVSSTTFFVKDIASIPLKKSECENILNDFIRTNEQTLYQKYTECGQDLSNDILLVTAETALVGLSSLSPISEALKLSRRFDSGTSLFHVKTLDELEYYIGRKPIDNKTFGDSGYKLSLEKGDYYVLNLNGPKEDVKELSTTYWNFVSDTYQKRLNLSDDEVSDFIQSSRQMEDRTTLIVSTEKGNEKSMRGGLAFVTSEKTDDLMPFEKATGIRVDRTPGRRVAEAVRFAVDEKKGDRKLSQELLNQLITSMHADNQLDSIYIFTSKGHERLYEMILKKRGIKFERVKDLDRDVILEIKR